MDREQRKSVIFKEPINGPSGKNMSMTFIERERLLHRTLLATPPQSNVTLGSQQEPRHPVLISGNSSTNNLGRGPPGPSASTTRKIFSQHPGQNAFDPGLLGTPEIKPKHMLPPLLPPEPMEGVPLGLELLVDVDKIKIKRQEEFLPEVMGDYETSKRYDILNGHHKRIYFAAETNNGSILTCGGVERPFQISILDFTGRVVLQLDRPCDQALYLTNCCWCCCCWFGRIGGKVGVYLGNGTHLGEIVHAFNCYRPLYNVLDPDGVLLLQVKGSMECGDCCLLKHFSSRGNTLFTLLTGDDEEIGIIQKEFAQVENLLGRQLFTLESCDVDAFEATFIQDLDVNLKALVFGVLFLLNSLYFKYEFPKYQRDGQRPELMTQELDLLPNNSEYVDDSFSTTMVEPSVDELFQMSRAKN